MASVAFLPPTSSDFHHFLYSDNSSSEDGIVGGGPPSCCRDGRPVSVFNTLTEVQLQQQQQQQLASPTPNNPLEIYEPEVQQLSPLVPTNFDIRPVFFTLPSLEEVPSSVDVDGVRHEIIPNFHRRSTIPSPTPRPRNQDAILTMATWEDFEGPTAGDSTAVTDAGGIVTTPIRSAMIFPFGVFTPPRTSHETVKGMLSPLPYTPLKPTVPSAADSGVPADEENTLLGPLAGNMVPSQTNKTHGSLTFANKWFAGAAAAKRKDPVKPAAPSFRPSRKKSMDLISLDGSDSEDTASQVSQDESLKAPRSGSEMFVKALDTNCIASGNEHATSVTASDWKDPNYKANLPPSHMYEIPPDEDHIDNIFGRDFRRFKKRRDAMAKHIEGCMARNANTGQMQLMQPIDIPKIFRHGIQYCPDFKGRLITREMERAEYECRAIMITNLVSDAEAKEILPKVRGGALERTTLTQFHFNNKTSVIAMIWFVNWRDAHAYAHHVKLRNLDDDPLTLRGRVMQVRLANTPSYLASDHVMRSIERGATRHVAIRDLPQDETLVEYVFKQLYYSFKPPGPGRPRQAGPEVSDKLEDAWVSDGALHLLFLKIEDAVRSYEDLGRSERLIVDAGVSKDDIIFDKDPCEQPLETLDDGKPLHRGDMTISLRDRWQFQERSFEANRQRNPYIKAEGFTAETGIRSLGKGEEETSVADPTARTYTAVAYRRYVYEQDMLKAEAARKQAQLIDLSPWQVSFESQTSIPSLVY